MTLVQLLQWTWPYAKSDDIARMLTWICLHELEKIAFPEPKVIQTPDRRQLMSLFDDMDSRGQGFCTPQDIAGGERPDEIRNIVDGHTVRAFLGDVDVGVNQFLELMCEDDYRGHAQATRVFTKDGRYLVYQKRHAVDFSGWFLEEVPPEEVLSRRIVDSLEAEICRWTATPTRELNTIGDPSSKKLSPGRRQSFQERATS